MLELELELMEAVKNIGVLERLNGNKKYISHERSTINNPMPATDIVHILLQFCKHS